VVLISSIDRHELPEDNDLTHQNIRDRYYGTNDPVAKKMLNRVRGGNTALTPPEDKTVVCVASNYVLSDQLNMLNIIFCRRHLCL
jgi:hypothetical protein